MYTRTAVVFTLCRTESRANLRRAAPPSLGGQRICEPPKQPRLGLELGERLDLRRRGGGGGGGEGLPPPEEGASPLCVYSPAQSPQTSMRDPPVISGNLG